MASIWGAYRELNETQSSNGNDNTYTICKDRDRARCNNAPKKPITKKYNKKIELKA